MKVIRALALVTIGVLSCGATRGPQGVSVDLCPVVDKAIAASANGFAAIRKSKLDDGGTWSTTLADDDGPFACAIMPPQDGEPTAFRCLAETKREAMRRALAGCLKDWTAGPPGAGAGHAVVYRKPSAKVLVKFEDFLDDAAIITIYQ
jgi:hypothetical protein